MTRQGTAAVSVIVPALDEAQNIAALVEELLAQGVLEVIVADNGSTDGTGKVAEAAGGLCGG